MFQMARTFCRPLKPERFTRCETCNDGGWRPWSLKLATRVLPM
jgi:hypothetical protein